MDTSTPATPSLPSPMRPAPAPRTPILVASGQYALRAAVHAQLADAGYRVAAAASTSNAAAYLHFATAPHLVLLDFRLLPRTAEPLLYMVEHDVRLQRHRYLLTLAEPRPRFSRATQRLITAWCTEVLTDVVRQPVDFSALQEALARGAAHLPVHLPVSGDSQ